MDFFPFSSKALYKWKKGNGVFFFNMEIDLKVKLHDEGQSL